MRRLGELPDSLPVELHPAAAAVRNLQQSGGSGGSSLSPFSLIGAITTGCNGFFVTFSLTSACIGGTVSAIPNITGSLAYPLGTTALAFLVLAFLLSLPALVLGGVLLQRAGARATGGVGDLFRKLHVPALNARAGESAAPCAQVGFAWAAFSCTVIGAAVGNSFLLAVLGNFLNILPSRGVSFPGRDATYAATAFSLVAAVLVTVAAGRCCCCRGPAGGALSAAPSLPAAPSLSAGVHVQNQQLNPVLAAAHAAPAQKRLPPGWRMESDGECSWYVDPAGESHWTLPGEST